MPQCSDLNINYIYVLFCSLNIIKVIHLSYIDLTVRLNTFDSYSKQDHCKTLWPSRHTHMLTNESFSRTRAGGYFYALIKLYIGLRPSPDMHSRGGTLC